MAIRGSVEICALHKETIASAATQSLASRTKCGAATTPPVAEKEEGTFLAVRLVSWTKMVTGLVLSVRGGL